MDILSFLKNYQKPVYQTFLNARKNDKLAHAYLLSGTPGMNLLEVALFLAKSILCEEPNSGYACLECWNCIRIEDNNYTDLIVVDGKKGRIKKKDIEQIELQFSQTAFEKGGKMIYILNLVEATTPIALNSLLKFLEEPGKDVYAFLTTENEARILPTILSRTQILNLKPIPRKTIIEDCLKAGVNKDDAELLSSLFTDYETIMKFAEDENYVLIKSLILDFLEFLSGDKENAIFFNQSEIISSVKTYEQIRLYLKLLADFFENILLKKHNKEIVLTSYDKIIEELAKSLSHLETSLSTILDALSSLDLNVNIGLTLDYVAYSITKD